MKLEFGVGGEIRLDAILNTWELHDRIAAAIAVGLRGITIVRVLLSTMPRLRFVSSRSKWPIFGPLSAFRRRKQTGRFPPNTIGRDPKKLAGLGA